MSKDGWGDGFKEQNSKLLKGIEKKFKTININLQEVYENEFDPNDPDFREKFGGPPCDWEKVEYKELFEVESEHIHTRLDVTLETTSYFVNEVNDIAGGNLNKFRKKDEYWEELYQDEIDGLKNEFDFICRFLSYENKEKNE